MNLEDFKSFRRVLIPSEVGSIPTHSRQLHRVIVLCALIAVVGAPAGARGAGASVPPGTPSPLQRAVRSAVFPAWGQLTNGKSKKAVVLFSVETYLVTRILHESREAHASTREADALREASIDDPSLVPLEEETRANAQDHYDTRRDLIFWTILAGFYGALDAYVDANLGDFGEELKEGRRLFASADPEERTMEIGVRF